MVSRKIFDVIFFSTLIKFQKKRSNQLTSLIGGTTSEKHRKSGFYKKKKQSLGSIAVKSQNSINIDIEIY